MMKVLFSLQFEEASIIGIFGIFFILNFFFLSQYPFNVKKKKKKKNHVMTLLDLLFSFIPISHAYHCLVLLHQSICMLT